MELESGVPISLVLFIKVDLLLKYSGLILLAVIHLVFFEDGYTSSKMVLIKKSGQFQKKCIAAPTHLIQNAIASLVINSETMKLFIDAFLTGLSSDMNRLCSLEPERSNKKTAEQSDVFFCCGVERREPSAS